MTPASSASVRMFESVRALTAEDNHSLQARVVFGRLQWDLGRQLVLHNGQPLQANYVLLRVAPHQAATPGGEVI